MWFDEFDSPLGPLLLVRGPGGFVEIRFLEGPRAAPVRPAEWARDPAAVEVLAAQLREYFAGVRSRFEVQLDPAGTEFQRVVWDELCHIPFGVTISYGQLAARIGRPSASRAVGLANGANPLPIVIPCHRVIGASGSLTGYGGGLDRKEFLLRLEGVEAPGAPSQRTLF